MSKMQEFAVKLREWYRLRQDGILDVDSPFLVWPDAATICEHVAALEQRVAALESEVKQLKHTGGTDE